MCKAKSEIFITGWMVTPFFLLVRPKSLDSEYRLDRVLQRCAENGVKVHIIVFQEPKLALNNDSEYTKRYL
jgi:phospholipase D1/2